MSSKLPSPDIVRKQALVHKFQKTQLHDSYLNQYNPLFNKTYEEKVSVVLQRKLNTQNSHQLQEPQTSRGLQLQKSAQNNNNYSKMQGLKSLVGQTQQDLKNTYNKIETNGACSLQVKHVCNSQQPPIYGHNKFMSQMVYQNQQSLKNDQQKATKQKEVSVNKPKAFDYESVVKRKQDQMQKAREMKHIKEKSNITKQREEQERIDEHKHKLILRQKRKDIKEFVDRDMSNLKTYNRKDKAIYTPSQGSSSISSFESEQDSVDSRFKDPQKVYRNQQRSLKRIERDNRYTDQLYVRRKKELARVFNEDPNYALTQIEFTVYVQDKDLLFHIANKMQTVNPKLFKVDEQELQGFIKKCDLFQLRNLMTQKITYDQFKQRTHRRTDEAYYITVDDLKDQGVQQSFFDDNIDHFNLVKMVGKDKFKEFMKCFYDVKRLESVSPSDMLREREKWQSNQRCIKSIYQMIPQEVKEKWTRDYMYGKKHQKFLKDKRKACDKIEKEDSGSKKMPELMLPANIAAQRHSSVVPGDRNKQKLDFQFMTEVQQNMMTNDKGLHQSKTKNPGSRLDQYQNSGQQETSAQKGSIGLKEQLAGRNHQSTRNAAGAQSVVSASSKQGPGSRNISPMLMMNPADRSRFNNSGMNIKENNFDQKQHAESRNKSVPPKRPSNNSRLQKAQDHEQELKNFSFLRQLKNDGKMIQVHPECQEFMYSKKEMQKKIQKQHELMFTNKPRPRDILGENLLNDIQTKHQRAQLEKFFLQCFIQQVQQDNQLKINLTESKEKDNHQQQQKQQQKNIGNNTNRTAYQLYASNVKSQHTSTSNFSFQQKMTGRQDPQLSLVQSTNNNTNTSQDILSVERMAEQFQIKMNKSVYNPTVKGLPSFRATTSGDDKLNISINNGRDTMNTTRIPFKPSKRIFNDSYDPHQMTQASNYKRLVSTAGQPTAAVTHMTKLSSRQNSKTLEGKDVISITDDGQNSIQNSQHTGGSQAQMSKGIITTNQQYSNMNIRQEIEDLLSPKTIMSSILKNSNQNGIAMKPYTMQKQRKIQQQNQQQLEAIRQTLQTSNHPVRKDLQQTGPIRLTDGYSNVNTGAHQTQMDLDVSEEGGDLQETHTDRKVNNLKVKLSVNKNPQKLQDQSGVFKQIRKSRGSNQDVTQVRVNNLALYNNLSSITQEILMNSQQDSQDVSKIHNQQIRKAYQSNLHSSTVEQSIGNSTQFRKSLRLEDQVSSPNQFSKYEIGGTVNIKNTQKYNGVIAIANQIESGMSELKSNRDSSILSPLSPIKKQKMNDNTNIIYLENGMLKTDKNTHRQTTPLTIPRQRVNGPHGKVQLSNIHSKEDTLSDGGVDEHYQQYVTMDIANKQSKGYQELKMDDTGKNLQEMMELDKRISEDQADEDEKKPQIQTEEISKKDQLNSNQDLLPVSNDESMHRIMHVGSYDESGNILLQTNNSLRSDGTKKFNGPPILSKMIIKKQPEKATQPVKMRNQTYNVNSFKQQINQMNIVKPALVKNYQKDSQQNSERQVVTNSRKTSKMTEHQPLVIINSGKNILKQQTTDRQNDNTVQNTYREGSRTSEDPLQEDSIEQNNNIENNE